MDGRSQPISRHRWLVKLDASVIHADHADHADHGRHVLGLRDRRPRDRLRLACPLHRVRLRPRRLVSRCHLCRARRERTLWMRRQR
jgi:hypothetical protein